MSHAQRQNEDMDLIQRKSDYYEEKWKKRKVMDELLGIYDGILYDKSVNKKETPYFMAVDRLLQKEGGSKVDKRRDKWYQGVHKRKIHAYHEHVNRTAGVTENEKKPYKPPKSKKK